MERVGEGEIVSVAVGEVALKGDVLTAVIEDCLEFFDFGLELEVLEKVRGFEIEWEGLVERDADGPGVVGGGGRVDGRCGEGDDVSDDVVIDFLDGRRFGGVGEGCEEAEGPLIADGEGRYGLYDDGVLDHL